MSRRIGSLIAACALWPLTAAGQVPIGAEFPINTYTTHYQAMPRVAVDAAGNAVVVWESDGQDGSEGGVFARRYDGSGGPVGGEFRVNTYTTGRQYQPAVAADAAGNFVVVWASVGEDSSLGGVFARRFNALGSPLGLPFRVNTRVTNVQTDPAIAMDGAGRFVVTWASFFQEDLSSIGVFAQRFDATGAPLGPEFRVNAYTTSDQRLGAPAMAGDGSFVVAWSSLGQDGSDWGIFAQRFDAAGTPAGPEFRVNAYTTNRQSLAAVAANAAGSFVVAWTSTGQDGHERGVFARRYDAAGAPAGSEFQVNVDTIGLQGYPSVTLRPSGAFAIAWYGLREDVDALVRLYDARGMPEGGEFRLNTYTTGLQYRVAIASTADGSTVATWASDGQDGSGDGIFGQRFLPDVIFRDDFEAGDLGVWSASATDGGDLTLSPDAALAGSTAGLRGVVDDTAGLYVQDDSPNGETRYRARFYFDPNGFDPGETLAHRRMRLFLAFAEPSRRVAAVVLRRISGAYSVRARARRDDNTQADTPFFPITDGPHAIEIELIRATGPDASDGVLRLWIDGMALGELTSLDNSLSRVDFARLGALSVKAGAAGTMFWDQFESRRLNPIGP